jgi:uncharacterized membrane protein YraQ (UPF0718 family)
VAELLVRKPRPSAASARFIWVLLASIASFAVLVRLLAPGRVGWIQAALIIFGGLVIQALPFVVLGALAAAVIEVFVPPSAFEKVADLPRVLQLPAAGLAGFVLPVCECGSVPIARRLIRRGLMPSAAITFMLAAPILNPIVIASTLVAYRGRGPLWTMVIGRFTLGLGVAIAIGWVLGGIDGSLLRRADGEDHHEHIALGRPEARWRTFFVHLGNDFLFMGRFLLIGAVVAALIQTFLPQSFLGSLAAIPVVDILVMMGIAVILSLCSESDAFIAASFVQFGAGAQLAFLVFGPMLDLKLGAIYAGTFKPQVLRAIVLTGASATLVATMWVSVIFG